MKIGAAVVKIGIYVDAPNLLPVATYHGHRHGMRKPRLDFVRLLQRASGGRETSRALLFLTQRQGDRRDSFAVRMRAAGYRLRVRRVRSGQQMESWESGIGMQILRDAAEWDVCVLCSGSGAFVPFVNQLRLQGKGVEVVAFPESVSEALAASASCWTRLGADDLFDAEAVQ